MSTSLKLKIVSPEKIVYDGDVEQVVLPGVMGEFQILPNHAPIISALEIGKVVYKPIANDMSSVEITGGFAEVQNNCVNICVELK